MVKIIGTLCGCVVLGAVATDIQLYKNLSCGSTVNGVFCANQEAGVCCSADELGDPETFSSCEAINDRKTIVGYAGRGSNECAVNAGISPICFSPQFDDSIQGCTWQEPATTTSRASAAAATVAAVAKRVNMNASESGQTGEASAPVCRGKKLYTARFRYVDGKFYLVKREDYDRPTFEALKTDAERDQYYRDRAYEIRDSMKDKTEQ